MRVQGCDPRIGASRVRRGCGKTLAEMRCFVARLKGCERVAQGARGLGAAGCVAGLVCPGAAQVAMVTSYGIWLMGGAGLAPRPRSISIQ